MIGVEAASDDRAVEGRSEEEEKRSEFTTAWRGDIYSDGTNAPVGAEQPVPNIRHRHRLKLPTDAFALGTWVAPSHRKIWCHCQRIRHRLVPPSGAYSSLGFWYQLVAPPGAYSRVLVPGGALTRYQKASL